MDWKGALVDNWPYKVAALALAVLLWFNVSANQDRMEQSVTTRLEFDVQDREWVALEAPREVRTVFRGRLGDLLGLPGDAVIRHTIEGVTDSVMTVVLDPSMVDYDRRLDVQPLSVRPSRVEIRFQRIVEKAVPVTVDISARPAEGFTLVGAPIVQPETVTVRGARDEVDAVSHVETEPVSLEGLERSATRQLPVLIPSDLESLSVEPEQVLATLRVDSLVERRLRVRLRAVGTAAAGVALSPDGVEVILRGPGAVVGDLEVRDLTASVRVDAVPDGEQRLPVRVSLPEGVPVTAEASPAAVTVTPVESGTEPPPDTSAAARMARAPARDGARRAVGPGRPPGGAEG